MSSESDNRTIRTVRGSLTVAELRERVTLLEDGIVKIVEVPDGTPEALGMLGELAQEVGRAFPKYVQVIDLTNADNPDAEYRAYIVSWMSAQPALHTAFVQANSALSRVATLFMMKRAGIDASVHKSLEAALIEARRRLSDAG